MIIILIPCLLCVTWVAVSFRNHPWRKFLLSPLLLIGIDPGGKWHGLSRALVIERERSRPDVWYYFRGRMDVICWRIRYAWRARGHSCDVGVAGIRRALRSGRSAWMGTWQTSSRPVCVTTPWAALCTFILKSSNKRDEARKMEYLAEVMQLTRRRIQFKPSHYK